ncbi:MAG: UDP-N-acetylglucosamine diphosphorylase [Ruminococcaceae bacterium]|nr:UDP-N-acetylglucosamine diphosphorylase [Oscillospiraceae bacterium]
MKAIIMAAGKGTRINDNENPMPKVLRPVNGRPILNYVFDAINSIEKKDITVIVGYMHEMVTDAFKDCGCNFALQGSDGYGTGYAVMCALESDSLKDYEGDLIVLSGDTPTVRKETVEAMINMQNENGNICTLLSVNSPENQSYGKIIRQNGKICDIVEVKDCNDEQRKICEVNAGLYVFNAKELREALKNINCNNKANEYYLTDVPKQLIKRGCKVETYTIDDISESYGINTFEELRIVEELLRNRATK